MCDLTAGCICPVPCMVFAKCMGEHHIEVLGRQPAPVPKLERCCGEQPTDFKIVVENRNG